MRVTGSIRIVLLFVVTVVVVLASKSGKLGSESRFRGELGIAAFEQFANHEEDGIGGRRTTRNEDVDGNDFVHGTDSRQQLRNNLGGHARTDAHVLAISAVGDGFHSEGIAHPRNIRGYGAVAERHQSFGSFPYQ